MTHAVHMHSAVCPSGYPPDSLPVTYMRCIIEQATSYGSGGTLVFLGQIS